MKNPQISNVVLPLALLGIALSIAPAAHAQEPPGPVTLSVNTVADLVDDNPGNGICHTSAGNCSLRAAIMEANHISGFGVTATIFVPAGTYVLTRAPSGADGESSGNLNLAQPLASNQRIDIKGAGAASTIIDGNQTDGVIAVEVDRVATIQDVTIRNGYKYNGAGIERYGGGIFNGGSLTIIHCVIEGNHDVLGGGIFTNYRGMLKVISSTIRSNIADSGTGGGIHLDGSATIRDSTIYGNGAQAGGAVFNSGFGDHLYIVNSTLSNNYSNSDGGGIYNAGATFIYNSTMVGNDANHNRSPDGGYGGGVFNQAGKRFVMVNALIAGNTELATSEVPDDCAGTFEAYGLNLFGEAVGCTFTGSGNAARGFVSLNTIGPLQNNGGPTLTHALLAGSQAIDSTTSAGCVDELNEPLITDQRGASRVIISNPRCDVGAFESPSIDNFIFANGFN